MPRGGKREGSGRKPGGVSEKEAKDLLRAVRKMGKAKGKSVGQILAEIIYSEQDSKTRLKAVDLYYKVTKPKRVHKDDDTDEPHGVVILPALKFEPSVEGRPKNDQKQSDGNRDTRPTP